MKVKFLKNHLDQKAGDTSEVEYTRGRYFINTGVAELAEGEDGKSPAKAVEVKSTPKSKAKKGKAKAEKLPIEDKSLKQDLENK